MTKYYTNEGIPFGIVDKVSSADYLDVPYHTHLLSSPHSCGTAGKGKLEVYNCEECQKRTQCHDTITQVAKYVKSPKFIEKHPELFI